MKILNDYYSQWKDATLLNEQQVPGGVGNTGNLYQICGITPGPNGGVIPSTVTSLPYGSVVQLGYGANGFYIPAPNYWVPERCNDQLCSVANGDLGAEFEFTREPNHPSHGTIHVKLISIGASTPTVTNVCNYGQFPPQTGSYNCPHYYSNFVTGNCLPDPAYGCTDPNATNYDPAAIVDDGSCSISIPGCTDPAANNYDPTATTDDGSCTFTDNCHTGLYFESCDNPNNLPGWNPGSIGLIGQTWLGNPGVDPCLDCNGGMCSSFMLGMPFALDSIANSLPGVIGKLDSWVNPTYGPADSAVPTSCPPIAGCTNPIAINYNPLAVIDDGSCLIYGCTDPQANNYDVNATVDDGSCTFDVLGCMDPSATNYDPLVTIDDGTCYWEGCTDPTAVNYLDNCAGNSVPNANVDDGCCDFLGCTDPAATNYDPNATIDDGSCVFPLVGCTDPSATNFNPLAVNDDGSCYWEGCTDSTATNYLFNCAGVSIPNADTDDGCCTYPVPGCTDPLATNYNSLATVDDGSCIYPIPGCTDPLAVNYDPLATIDDGSCDYLGCTDPLATNYNPNATIDDGSCIYPIPGCTDPIAINYDPTATVDDGSCLYDGCMDTNATNYDPNANADCLGVAGGTDTSCCTYPVPGCPDPTVVGPVTTLCTPCELYDSSAIGCPDNNGLAIPGDSSCCCILGCTDPIATNYDPLACIDDGSCQIPPPLDCSCCDIAQPGNISLPTGVMIPPGSPLYSQGCTALNGANYSNCDTTQVFDPTDCEPDCTTFDFSNATNQPNSLGSDYTMIITSYNDGLLNGQQYGIMDGNSPFCWEHCGLNNGNHWACDCCGDIYNCDQDWYWPKPYGCWTCDALQGSTCSQQTQNWMSNNMSNNYYNDQNDCVAAAPTDCSPTPDCNNTPNFCSETPSLTPGGACWICHHGHVCLPVYDYLEYGSGPPGSTGTYTFMMNWLIPQNTIPVTYKTGQGSDLFCNQQDCMANSVCDTWEVWSHIQPGCDPPQGGCPPGEVWWPYPKCECGLPKKIDPVDHLIDKEKEMKDIKKIDVDVEDIEDVEDSLKEEFTRMNTIWDYRL